MFTVGVHSACVTIILANPCRPAKTKEALTQPLTRGLAARVESSGSRKRYPKQFEWYVLLWFFS